MSFHILCSRKTTYKLLISIGYITVRFLQMGKQTQQELSALYKLMGSFQQKLLLRTLTVSSALADAAKNISCKGASPVVTPF